MPPLNSADSAPTSRATWIAGTWVSILLALLVAAQTDVGGLYVGTDVRVGRAFIWLAISNLFWPAVFPLIARLGHRFPLQRGGMGLALPVHLGASLALAVAHAIVAVLIAVPLGVFPALQLNEEFPAAVGAYLAIGLHFEVVIYWGVLAAILTLKAHRSTVASDRRAAELELRLSAARLDALQSRIQPHFFFNSLNTVSMMVREGDNPGAVQTLADIGDLMRRTLETPVGGECSIGDELELIRHYLAIERARFPDRLSWDITVEPGVTALRIPALLLQPLVENAIQHGIAVSPEAGRIAVRVGVFGGEALGGSEMLEMTVTDDGPGEAESGTRISQSIPDGSADRNARGTGTGIRNTRARILARFGTGSLEVLRQGQLTVARIRIPMGRVRRR